MTSPVNTAAIGVFDSGVGGLSVLRHIRAALPAENLLYLADAGFAPSLVAGDSSLLHAARLSKSRPLAKLSKRFGVMVLSID